MQRVRSCGLFVAATAVASAGVVTMGTSLGGYSIASARPTATATVSGAADDNSAFKWYGELVEPYKVMDAALKTFSNGIRAQDVALMGDGCNRITNAANKFEATLPSPDAKVNFRIQSLVDNLNSAASLCATYGAGTTWESAAPMMDYIDDANNDIRVVKQILRPVRK
jgi:hypothetical protein